MAKRFLWVVMVLLTLTACSKVPAGNVGIRVNLLGSNKGVDLEEINPGWVWVGPTQELYLFPTYTQTYTWEEQQNEQIGFQTIEGLPVAADVGITYHINKAKATDVFQKYRRGVDEITDLYLRNMVRDSLVQNASQLSVEAVYGAGKADLINRVQKDVTAEVAPIGIEIEKVYWIGEIKIPSIVQNAIANKIQATQIAQQRENEIAKARAEADIQIAQARGVAESQLTQARAQAQAVEMQGKAEASAIKAKSDALRSSPELIELTKAEKWNGQIPVTYNMGGGGVVPFMQIPTGGR